jgi:hypothetical protein
MSRCLSIHGADEFNYGHTRRHRRDYPDAVEVYVNALNALPDGAKAKIIGWGANQPWQNF